MPNGFSNIKCKDYCNLKFTGSVYFTRTGWLRCFPGVHLGMLWITRTASLSRLGSTPRTTCTSTIEPSFINHKLTNNASLNTVFLSNYRVFDVFS